MKKLGSATDPLWYKDAVIYELHVRAFADSNGDGIGDFAGLMSKLDYLQDLGVTCLWLLPFFPSPLRDDGYDIADYVDVNPSYGTMNDFKQFLDAAHQRNMQVMIELVINHTSDQHPWFQAARLAPPGSPEREMYVWSDTTKLYEGVRIIFTDTEKSNWTWDETAQAFYWHRFFSHQPDLNFDNPRVMEEVLKAMRFWLDMGVDALRLDAIPYLVERDGTSCENVPETHVKIKQVREALDQEYADRVILAEANMWPADVRPYFGDGDECHMAFHFPLMPRIYMALRQEDRLPITDIMAQTPAIPESCQWGIFLRNHDELTLEMVTDEERDYMYLAYSADPRMRINVGIRRRLAPLIDNNRRRIELLNSLLLSFPGTPIMYYGDEIGMGDNIYLGDRNGVRTPMQWSSDRNAGFSKADPARLYFPVIMDPVYGYQVINVEAQLSDQSSLLHWMRNMIALRKLFPVFGRGTQTFLHPENRKILAYIRDYTRDDVEGESAGRRETVLCVANLSRFAQPVTLDLAQFAGMVPVEMQGYVRFPQITAGPYPLTLTSYGFLWFELQQAPEPVPPPAEEPQSTGDSSEQVALDLLTKGWAALLAGTGRQFLEARLPAWIARQRWFGAKSQTIASVRLAEWVELRPSTGATPDAIAPAFAADTNTLGSLLLLLEITYTDGACDRYQLPLSYASGEAARLLAERSPGSVVATLTTPTGPAVLYDAANSEALRQGLLSLIVDGGALPVGNAHSAAGAVATTIVAAHESRPAHEIASDSPATAGVAEAIALTHSIEPSTVAPEFTGHMPGAPATTTAPSDAAAVLPFPSSGDKPVGKLTARHSPALAAVRGDHPLPSRTGSAEQSNTNFIYGETLLLKLFRRLETGENPDVEIGRFLTDVAHFAHIAPLLGEITLEQNATEPITLAMLQPLIANQGDGWQWALDELGRFFDAVAGLEPPPLSDSDPVFGQPVPSRNALLPFADFLRAAELLGRRTGEMHRALATRTADPAFAAEPFTFEDLAQDGERIAAQIKLSLNALESKRASLEGGSRQLAEEVLSRRNDLLRRASTLGNATSAAGQRIRIHGDFHLGQLLRTADDFVFLDFEGEPARPLAARRRKQSPLRDVAGMLRSFSYAAASALASRGEAATPELESWAEVWRHAVSAGFLAGYAVATGEVPGLLPPPAAAQLLLESYVLEKALYELLYELNHRPDWVAIPLAGILALMSV